MITKAASTKTDPTAAERARRYRERRKQGKRKPATPPPRPVTAKPVGVPVPASRSASRVTVPASVTVPAWRVGGVTRIMTFLAGLALATVSAGFSVVGLTSVFVGAYWPIIGMGLAFEFGKLAAITWLGRHHAAPRAIKGAAIAMVCSLMLLSAIGSYGFLARAHIDHTVTADVAIAGHSCRREVEARSPRQRLLPILTSASARLTPPLMKRTRRGRTTTALSIVSQQREIRGALVADRLRAANALASPCKLKTLPLLATAAKLKADAGPVHYLARLVGADDESVTRWFILIVAFLIDPLRA